MIIELYFKILISVFMFTGGVYVLTHVKPLARRLQEQYIHISEESQKKTGTLATLNRSDPEKWKTPHMTFMFKAIVGFLGVWLLLGVIAVFGPIEL